MTFPTGGLAASDAINNRRRVAGRVITQYFVGRVTSVKPKSFSGYWVISKSISSININPLSYLPLWFEKLEQTDFFIVWRNQGICIGISD
jgi:hypothetical protein